MTDNMKAFLDKIQENEELREKFNEISKEGMEEQKDYAQEYIALARGCGITLTREDFEFDEEELSDEELENVSGGGSGSVAGAITRAMTRAAFPFGVPKRFDTGEKKKTTEDQGESES